MYEAANIVIPFIVCLLSKLQKGTLLEYYTLLLLAHYYQEYIMEKREFQNTLYVLTNELLY